MKCRGRSYFGRKSMPKPNSSAVISLPPNISTMAFFLQGGRVVFWLSASSFTLNSVPRLYKAPLGTILGQHIDNMQQPECNLKDKDTDDPKNLKFFLKTNWVIGPLCTSDVLTSWSVSASWFYHWIENLIELVSLLSKPEGLAVAGCSRASPVTQRTRLYVQDLNLKMTRSVHSKS